MQDALRQWTELLAALDRGEIATAALVAQWREVAHGLNLPPRYVEVMETVLQSLESSALFDGHACGFDHPTLMAQLRQWLVACERLG